MPQGVLPSSRVLPVVGEAVGDEFVNLGERQHLVPRGPYRHRRKRYVGVGRFLITVGIARGPRHSRRAARSTRDTEAQCFYLTPASRTNATFCRMLVRAPASFVSSRMDGNTRQAALGLDRRRQPFPSDPTTGTRGRPRRARFDPVPHGRSLSGFSTLSTRSVYLLSLHSCPP